MLSATQKLNPNPPPWSNGNVVGATSPGDVRIMDIRPIWSVDRKLCLGLANSGFFAPEYGRAPIPPTPKSSRPVLHEPGKRSNRRHLDEQARILLFLSVPHRMRFRQPECLRRTYPNTAWQYRAKGKTEAT